MYIILADLELQPAGIDSRHGDNPVDRFLRIGHYRHPGQVIHPAAGRKMHLAEVDQARDDPGVVRREDVETRVPLFEHHRKHFFGTVRKRVERLVAGARLARHLVFEPGAKPFLKAVTHDLHGFFVVLDEKIPQAV